MVLPHPGNTKTASQKITVIYTTTATKPEDVVIPLVKALRKNLLSADDFQRAFDRLSRPDRMRLLETLEDSLKK